MNICINKNIDCKVDISDFSYLEPEKQRQICTSHEGEFFNNTDDTNQKKYSEYPLCIGDASPFGQYHEDQNIEYLRDKLIYEAIKVDNKTQFIELLNYDRKRKMFEPLKYGYHGNTILHEAIYWNSRDILGFLLTNVCNNTLKKKNKDGNTILHLATLVQLDSVVKLLLKNYICSQKSVLSMTNLEGDTPFLCAIRTGSDNMLDIYLNLFHIRDFSNQRNANNKYNSLHVAATTSIKNFNIIKKLLRLGIDMVDKNTKKHYFFDEETGKDELLDVIPENEEKKPDNSILED